MREMSAFNVILCLLAKFDRVRSEEREFERVD